MISFTITEKGYTYNEADLARGLSPMFAMGKVCALLFERFKAGELPLTVGLTSVYRHHREEGNRLCDRSPEGRSAVP